MTTAADTQTGGCDRRYAEHACVWGRAPDPSALALARHLDLRGATVLDAGCGEGRNARFLAGQGAHVEAVDVSALAIRHLRAEPAGPALVAWRRADVRTLPLAPGSLDGVLACALLHWLPSEGDVAAVLDRLQRAARPGGVHALTVFNARVPYEPPSAESHLPCLLPHAWYLGRYDGWEVLDASDTDSTGSHPGHEEVHTHAVTRLVARRTS
ncbi:MAG TPA: class I SAM-dependent methyltransferase [Solirubrobacteraceae bacterium]|jgi:SAM-dependent methyltransferase|nr:class I SAM-dependent methyltransferase [Solirubrobacteraceae bacterium]